MSGSGGGGSDDDKGNWRPVASVPKAGGGDGGGTAGANPCLFTELAVLSSPNSQVVGNLPVDSILNVVLEETPLRVVATHHGAIAGSITSARLADIIECIRGGQVYEARVTHINGGIVRVEIYPA
ncbi:hypothetical protein EHS39_23560 [Ensifer sp. MPMI2T]|nr:hypothetical protein EHS39_23560 [Ensifer sp. MPMI2T]